MSPKEMYKCYKTRANSLKKLHMSTAWQELHDRVDKLHSRIDALLALLHIHNLNAERSAGKEEAQVTHAGTQQELCSPPGNSDQDHGQTKSSGSH